MAKAPDILTNKKKIARNVDLAGGKAHNLARLSLAGFNVPEFFVVPASTVTTDQFDKGNFRQSFKNLVYNLTADAQAEFVARSSSPMEDQLDHSFAGLFHSYLHFASIDDLLSAIHKIRSLSHQTVEQYAGQKTGSPTSSMAVIVQRMIRAKISGVLFTAHPVSGSPDTMLLEMVKGDCEQLVSGSSNAVQVTIDKKSNLFETTVQDVPGNEIYDFINSDKHVQQLIQLGRQIDYLFGLPQDIEWAYDGHQFWILQSRPISTLYQNNPAVCIDEAGVKWSNYFFSERFVQPLSPLGWSFLQPIIKRAAIQDPLRFLGYDKTAVHVKLKLIDGLPFTQLANYQRLYKHIPVSFISADKKQTLELAQTRHTPLRIRNYAALLSRLVFAGTAWVPQVNLQRWKTFERVYSQKTLRAYYHINDLNYSEAVELFKSSQEWSIRFLKIHRWSITWADIFMALLGEFLSKIELRQHNSLESLLGGLPNNATVQANEALIRLDTNSVLAMQKFVTAFGHRAESLDIACSTWGEDFEFIEQMSSMLKKQRYRFEASQEKNIKTRLHEQQSIHQQIKNHKVRGLFLAPAFKILLFYAQQFAMLRENQRNLWHKILRTSRLSALQIGTHLAEYGHVAEPNDVFYLTCKELSKISQQDFKRRVLERKEMLEKMSSVQNSQLSSFGDEFKKDHDVLHGLGVSVGRIRGQARIANTYADAMKSQPGEILIVPSADPAWSPIFGVISGLVMERGGILSHASILAREFRLPTITNIAHATQRLKNGDEVEIDGQEGSLRLFKTEQV